MAPAGLASLSCRSSQRPARRGPAVRRRKARPASAARAAAGAALAKLVDQPADSPLAERLGDRFMFEDHYAERSPEQVAGVFGAAFAQSLSALKAGAWQGPVESGLGWHLLFIDSLTPGRLPILEEIEADVRAEWINAQRADNQGGFSNLTTRLSVGSGADVPVRF